MSEQSEAALGGARRARQLSSKDVVRAYALWYWFEDVAHSYDRMQGLSSMVSMALPLRKLYPHDDDVYRSALQRTARLFATEGIIGLLVNGMALSMEEELANGADIPSEVIFSLRSALVGPACGIGDTLIWGTMRTIFLSLATTFMLAGNPLALVVAPSFSLSTYYIGRWLYLLGYKAGREAVMSMMRSGLMDRMIVASGMLGLMMMGALSASYVSLKIATTFTLQNSADPISIQGSLDSIAAGIRPLSVICLVYLYLRRHGNRYGVLIVGLLALALIASFFGVVQARRW